MATEILNDPSPALEAMAEAANAGFLPDFAGPSKTPINQMVLGFRVGEFGFLVPVSLHCEVIEQTNANPLPKVEPWFSGLLNIRGNIVPVVDLLRFMSDTDKPPKKRYLFAIDRAEKSMVVWIDGYPQMLTGVLQPLDELPPLPARLARFVSNAYTLDGQIWLNVQLEQIFKTLGRQTSAKEAA